MIRGLRQRATTRRATGHEDTIATVPIWQLLALANGVEDTPPIDPAAMFKMHMEGLPANVANTVQVSNSLVPSEQYLDTASTSSMDFESALWSVIYEGDPGDLLRPAEKDQIKQTLGINAICATELTATITTSGGDSLQACFRSQGVVATAIFSTEAVISWATLPNAIGYQVLRSTDIGGTYFPVGAVDGTRNVFRDIGLNPWAHYFYCNRYPDSAGGRGGG